MMTLEAIRADLREIRYYYAHKELFDSAVGGLGGYIVLEKIKRYNEAVRHAPLKLVDIYIHLYIKNYTQEGLSVELNYSPEHIQRLNKQLLLFLQAKLSEERSSA